MPYFIAFVESDTEGIEHIENAVSSIHPSKWFEKTEELWPRYKNDKQIKLLWWAEISDEEALTFDPDYSVHLGLEYYGRKIE